MNAGISRGRSAGGTVWGTIWRLVSLHEARRRLAAAGRVLRHGVPDVEQPARGPRAARTEVCRVVGRTFAVVGFDEDWPVEASMLELEALAGAAELARQQRAADWVKVERGGWPC